MKPSQRKVLDALTDALTNRPWKRVVSFVALLYFLWVVLPWFLNAPPMEYGPYGPVPAV